MYKLWLKPGEDHVLLNSALPSGRSWRSCGHDAGCDRPGDPWACRRSGLPDCAGLVQTPPEEWCPWSNHSTAPTGWAGASRSQEEGSWRWVAELVWSWRLPDYQTCNKRIRSHLRPKTYHHHARHYSQWAHEWEVGVSCISQMASLGFVLL